MTAPKVRLAKIARKLLLASCAAFLPACSENADRLAVLAGAAAFRRGDYPDAIANFAAVSEKAADAGDSLKQAVADFDLAATYLAMGERDAAREIFESLEKIDGETAFRAEYELGVIAWQEEDFEAAASHFKEALRLKGGDIDAKANLELSLKRLDAKKAEAAAQREKAAAAGPAEEMEKAFFNAIREAESRRWKSLPQSEDGDALDY